MSEEAMMPSTAFCVAALMIEAVIGDLESQVDRETMTLLANTLRKMSGTRHIYERLEALDSPSPTG